MFKHLVPKVFITVAVFFIQISVCNFVFADFIVGIEGVRNSKDIVEVQGAGFNAVTIDSDISAASSKVLTTDFVKHGIVVSSSTAKCDKISLLSGKDNLLKKDDLRFLSYKAILGGSSGIFYEKCYFGKKPIYEQFSKAWEDIIDVISEISFVAEIIDRGNKIENPFEISEKLRAVSYQYGGIKYTFILNPTEQRQTLPSQFFQPNFDVVGEKHSALKKIIRNSKNNFKQNKVFVFRYE